MDIKVIQSKAGAYFIYKLALLHFIKASGIVQLLLLVFVYITVSGLTLS